MEFVFTHCVGVGAARSINFLILGNAFSGDAFRGWEIATPMLERRPFSEAIRRSSV